VRRNLKNKAALNNKNPFIIYFSLFEFPEFYQSANFFKIKGGRPGMKQQIELFLEKELIDWVGFYHVLFLSKPSKN